MTRYFFHLVTQKGYSPDEEGSEFPDADAAYLYAARAAVELGIEALRRFEDPSTHRFEVFDDRQQHLFDIQFSEMLAGRRRVPPPPNGALWESLEARVRRGQELQAELAAGVSQLQRTLATTRALLREASSTPYPAQASQP